MIWPLQKQVRVFSIDFSATLVTVLDKEVVVSTRFVYSLYFLTGNLIRKKCCHHD